MFTALFVAFSTAVMVMLAIVVGSLAAGLLVTILGFPLNWVTRRVAVYSIATVAIATMLAMFIGVL